ncbi:hypothetical protein ACIBF1_26895 [Spirillospora sp. NPDC050679]
MTRRRPGATATTVLLASAVLFTGTAAAAGPVPTRADPVPTGCGLVFADEHPYRHYYWRNCSATNARVEVGYRNGSRTTVCVESFHHRHLARRHHDEQHIPISWARRVGTCP